MLYKYYFLFETLQGVNGINCWLGVATSLYQFMNWSLVILVKVNPADIQTCLPCLFCASFAALLDTLNPGHTVCFWIISIATYETK